jgi:hypothetical protein
MKIVICLFWFALTAVQPAAAEFLQMDLSIFGMD